MNPPIVGEQLDAANLHEASVPSLGQQLAARRQAEGWTIEQVAAQLKLAPRQIEAMESDRLDALPGTVVARGFIRTYARLLKMDPAPLLATTAADTPSPIDSIRKQRPLSAPFSETRLPSMHTRTALPKAVVGLLLVLVLGGGIWSAQQFNWLSALPGPLLGALGTGSSPDAAPVPAVPEVEAMVVAPVEPPAPQAVTAAAQTDLPLVAPLPVEPDAPQVATAVPTPAPAAVAGSNLLHLSLSQDSWIEIKRQDKSVLVSRLAKAGTTESFEIVEPVSLVVGNVAGVEASLRDVPLDLKSVTSTNVARINLK